MSAPAIHADTFGDDGWPAAELDRLQAAIVDRLRHAGVELPDADVTMLAQGMLADSVQICLAWMERD